LRAQWLIIHLGISLAQANTAGHTKKNVQYSILYIGYALGMSIWPQETCAMSGLNPTLIRWQTGNLIGPQTFRESQAPEYTGGFTVMFISYCFCIGMMFAYWTLAVWMNSRRPSVAHEEDTDYHDDSGELSGCFSDKTDFQQKHFLYTT
jgi:hypothetical protein